jgi:hypothetical protein
MNSRIAAAALLGITAAAGPGLAGDFANQSQPATPNTASEPAKAAAPQADAPIGSADDLLTRLETADKDLKSLEAEILYDRVFGLAGDRQIRTGKLFYVDSKEKDASGQPAPGSRKFAIRFDSLQLGDQAARKEEKTVVFDGRWLIEKLPSEKIVTKREVVPVGKAFDPLKIGEGPFPIPVGQRREDILKRFDAQLLPAEEGLKGNEPGDTPKLKAFVTKAKAYQLKLTPKPDPNQDFKEVRLWYAPDEASHALLPILARTVNQQDDVSIVELVNVKLNQPAPQGVFDAQVPEGWKLQEQNLPAENRR